MARPVSRKAIWEARASGMTYRQLAELFGISRSAAYYHINGRTS